MSGSNVGVVITCYELGRTLPEAVESVWAQTEPAREIIVVDDGSEDVLTRQVLVWLEEDSRPVRVIRSVHRGAAYARNLGLAETTAPLAVLLDGDDAFEPRYLELAAPGVVLLPGVVDVPCVELPAVPLPVMPREPVPVPAAELRTSPLSHADMNSVRDILPSLSVSTELKSAITP